MGSDFCETIRPYFVRERARSEQPPILKCQDEEGQRRGHLTAWALVWAWLTPQGSVLVWGEKAEAVPSQGSAIQAAV